MTFTDDISETGSAPSSQAANEDHQHQHAGKGAEKEPSDLQWLQQTERHRPDKSVPFCKLFLDNWLYVVTYCGVFGSFGVCVGFLGPTVFDLGCQTNTDLKRMNWVFFVQLIMTLVGSISAGCLVVRVPVHLLMLSGALGVSLCMFFIPACSSLGSLILVLIIMGWCMGCLDCLANLRMIQMFGNNVGPFLQLTTRPQSGKGKTEEIQTAAVNRNDNSRRLLKRAAEYSLDKDDHIIRMFSVKFSYVKILSAMHCLYGVGAFVSPMIASAFLLNTDCTPYIDGFTVETPPQNGTGANSTSTEPATAGKYIPPQPHRVFRYRHMSRLPSAFYILGAIQLFFAGLVVYVIFQEKIGKLKPNVGSSGHHDNSHAESSTSYLKMNTVKGCRCQGCVACGPREVMAVTFLTCLLLFVFDGLQSSYANYIYTYAYESKVKGLQTYEGAVLDACFWGMFALGRIIAVPVASQFTASFMLVINIAGCAIALLVTIIFRWSHTVIYVGTCGVGLFISSMSPTVMAMTEQYVDINSSIATCMVVVAALGEALCPVIVGNLVVTSGPGSFLVFCFTLSLSAVLLYICLTLAGGQTDKYRACDPTSFMPFMRFPSHRMSQEGESTVIKPSRVKYYNNEAVESDSNLELPDTETPDSVKDYTK